MRRKLAYTFVTTSDLDLEKQIQSFCESNHVVELAEDRSAPALAFSSDGLISAVAVTCVFERTEDSELVKQFK